MTFCFTRKLYNRGSYYRKVLHNGVSMVSVVWASRGVGGAAVCSEVHDDESVT